MAKRLAVDVFGKRMEVERLADGWRLFKPGSDGKRSLADVAIRAFVAEDEPLQYLDDVYHELATPANPCVRRVPLD